ncbi:hypothetical protein V1478_012186 [Vespula squamosa]|uniref:Uncharacterized protein n=1 Tax=Vespula squamosa TaxID=30214 RepID=A0ABD2AF50_VESSQ
MEGEKQGERADKGALIVLAINADQPASSTTKERDHGRRLPNLERGEKRSKKQKDEKGPELESEEKKENEDEHVDEDEEEEEVKKKKKKKKKKKVGSVLSLCRKPRAPE